MTVLLQCPGCLEPVQIREIHRAAPPVAYDGDVPHVCAALERFRAIIEYEHAKSSSYRVEPFTLDDGPAVARVGPPAGLDGITRTPRPPRARVGRPGRKALAPTDRIEDLRTHGAFVVDRLTNCWRWTRFCLSGRPCMWDHSRSVRADVYFYKHLRNDGQNGFALQQICTLYPKLCINPDHQRASPVVARVKPDHQEVSLESTTHHDDRLCGPVPAPCAEDCANGVQDPAGCNLQLDDGAGGGDGGIGGCREEACVPLSSPG